MEINSGLVNPFLFCKFMFLSSDCLFLFMILVRIVFLFMALYNSGDEIENIMFISVNNFTTN